MDHMNNESGIDMGFDTELLLRESSFDTFLDDLNTEFSGGSPYLSLSTPVGHVSGPLPNPSSVPANFNIPPSPYFKSKPMPLVTPPQQSQGLGTTVQSFKSNSLIKSRTQLRQDLMREKTVEEERREAEQKRAQQARLNSSPSVPLPTSLTPSALPPQVLQVHTRLENPTPLHRVLSQQRQVRQYLHETTGPGGSVPPSPIMGASSVLTRTPAHLRLQEQLSGPHALSAPATVQLGSPRHFPTSPAPLSSLATSVTSIASTAEVEEAVIVADILALEQETGGQPGEAQGLEELLSSLHCSSADALSRPESRDPNQFQTSFSFPPVVEEQHRIEKDRQRKDNHNKIERKRRFNINDRIKELSTLLPKDPHDPYYEQFGEFRHHKGNVLKASVDYIKLLREEFEKSRNKDARIRDLELASRTLLLRIRELEDIARNNGITIPESDLTWRPGTVSHLNQLCAGTGAAIQVKTEPNQDIDVGAGVIDLMDDDTMRLGEADPMLTQTSLDLPPAEQLHDHNMDFF